MNDQPDKITQKRPTNNTAVRIIPMPGHLVLDGKYGRETNTHTSGGIIIPDKVNEKSAPMGKVLVVPNDLREHFAPEDVVYFRRLGEFRILVAGIEYLVMPKENVLCKLESVAKARRVKKS